MEIMMKTVIFCLLFFVTFTAKAAGLGNLLDSFKNKPIAAPTQPPQAPKPVPPAPPKSPTTPRK
jgi:hypothetical protein